MFILDVLALLTTTVAAAASTQNLMLAAVGSIALPLIMIWLSQQRPPIAVAEVLSNYPRVPRLRIPIAVASPVAAALVPLRSQ